jgi:predicted TIM-barrel fold metal-dependent hydrolase
VPKYPDTPVVIDHFARIGVDGKIRDEDVKNLCKLAKHDRTSVKISAYYALGKKRSPYTDLIPMIQKLLDTFGPDRLMWATDCPYQVDPGHNYHDSIALIRDEMKLRSRPCAYCAAHHEQFFGEGEFRVNLSC